MYVDLDDFFAITLACISHIDRHIKLCGELVWTSLFQFEVRQIECGVAQAVAEREVHIALYRLIVPVANVDVLAI